MSDAVSSIGEETTTKFSSLTHGVPSNSKLKELLNALKKEGCAVIHQEIASGAKTDRPVLNKIIENESVRHNTYPQ